MWEIVSVITAVEDSSHQITHVFQRSTNGGGPDCVVHWHDHYRSSDDGGVLSIRLLHSCDLRLQFLTSNNNVLLNFDLSMAPSHLLSVLLLLQLVWCGLQCGLPSEVWTMSWMWLCWKELLFIRVGDLWLFCGNTKPECVCMLMCAGVFTLTLLLNLIFWETILFLK